jgi:hypothetical protein
MDFKPMTADECSARALECAAKAALAANELVSSEFLKMAAQWRAMAASDIFLGHVETALPTRSAGGIADALDEVGLPRESAD